MLLYWIKIFKEGDITDQKFRDMIIRETHDVKSKLDGLARKDLLAAIDYFEEGLVIFYGVIDSNISALSSNAESQTISLAKKVRKLNLSDLDQPTTMVLSNVKRRFEDARRKATEAFNSEALQPSDRVVAMGYPISFPEPALPLSSGTGTRDSGIKRFRSQSYWLKI